MIFKDLAVPEKNKFNSISIYSELFEYLGYANVNKVGFLF